MRTRKHSSLWAYATTKTMYLDIRCKRPTLMISKKMKNRKKKTNKENANILFAHARNAQDAYLQK